MSSEALEKSQLTKAWLHCHEEDTPTSTVYRPAEFPFGPSRGRTGFHLRPDGTMTFRQPGATDQTETTGGTWKLEGDNLELAGRGSSQNFRIESLGPDRLVVSKGTCATSGGGRTG